MRRSFYLLPLLALLSLATLAHADDQTRDVQQALKDQGFYYGQVDGQPGPETDAAVKRYQIRQGLEVTGKLDAQTLASLKGGSADSNSDPNALHSVPPPQDDSAQAAPATAPTAAPAPDVVQSDRNFLKDQPPRSAPAPEEEQAPPQPEQPMAPPVAPPPPAIDEGQTLPRDYSFFFRKTPYESAPPEVQRSTVHQAQVILGRKGFFRGVADGELSKQLNHAISAYQKYAELHDVDGRLNMETLADMNLLPRRRVVLRDPAPPAPPVYRPPVYAPPPPDSQPGQVYRGIWVH